MKFVTQDRPIERIGVETEKAFAIKATGKAFRILSSGLYKDKILAIVRELSCNAYDAHKAAGNEKTPFVIHLPNALEPFFSIRDFGTGLSHDDLMTIYTTYFESTKTESNDYIGALGLGSKSPFSYVDSFTVTSYFNGVQRTYTAFINEYDCPTVVQMGGFETDEDGNVHNVGTPTDQPNGLEVIIPVESSRDFTEFANRSMQALELFDPTPIVKGWANFRVNKPKVLIEGKGYRIIDRHQNQGGARAIMGAVAYPIWANSIPVLSQTERDFFSLPLDIDFAMGALEFTAGREELSYDKRVTIPALQERVKEIVADLPQRLETVFANCKNELEARILYGELFTPYSTLGRVAKGLTLRWKGRVINSKEFKITLDQDDDIAVYGYADGPYGGVRMTTYRPLNADATLFIPASKKLQVYTNDLKRGASVRCRHVVKQDSSAIVFLLSGDQEKIDEIIDTLNGVEVKGASTLEKPPSNPKTKTKVRKMTLGAMQSGSVSRDYLNEATVDIEDGGIYISTKSNVVEGVESNKLFTEMFNAYRDSGLIDIKTEEIFVVPFTLKKDFEESEDWVNLIDVMREKAAHKLKSESATEAFTRARSLKTLKETVYNLNDKMNRLGAMQPHLPVDHPINAMTNAWKTQGTWAEKAEALERLATSFGIEVPSPKVNDDILSLWNKMLKRYPMIGIVLNHGYYSVNNKQDYKEMADYVRLVDTCKN